MKQMRPGRSSQRAGVAYLLTMLYLMLFTVLAIGFAAASTVAVQMAGNDRCAADAQSAAESGMEFVRYQLGRAIIPKDAFDANPLAAIAKSLGDQLDGSANMAGHHVSVSNGAIELPDDSSLIVLDPALGTTFHAQITIETSAVRVKIVGHGRGDLVARAIQLDFRPEPSKLDGHADAVTLAPVAESYREVSP